MATHELKRSFDLNYLLVYLFFVVSGLGAVLLVELSGTGGTSHYHGLVGGIAGFGLGFYSVYWTENERLRTERPLRSRVLFVVASICVAVGVGALTLIAPVEFWSGVVTMAVGHFVGWLDYYR